MTCGRCGDVEFSVTVDDERTRKQRSRKMKISIRKKASGNRHGRSSKSDLYMSKVVNNGRKIGLSIRISRPTMDVLRWRAGDRVTIDFERDGDTGTLLLTRTDSADDGLCISAIGKTGSGQVRASLELDNVPYMFPNGQRGYHGHCVNGGPSAGEFLIEYKPHD